MNRLLFPNCLCRRRFLLGVGSVAGAGLGVWGALAASTRKTVAKRIAPEDGLSLSEYLRREASKMEVFPYALLAISGVRFQAASTFERYLTFYRYKERGLASTKEEIDECVREVDSLGAKEKALALCATFLFDCVYRNEPPKFGHYQNRYQEWRKYVKALSTAPDRTLNQSDGRPFRPSVSGVNKERAYEPDNRSYFPYYYPALAFFSETRKFLILGAPSPDRRVDEECCQRWQAIRDEYKSSSEVAFPAIPLGTVDDSDVGDCESSLRKLEESPLHFPARERLSIAYNSGVEVYASRPRRSDAGAFLDDNEKKRWGEWFKNIEECVAIIDRELGLKIPAERWISDYYPDAEPFLEKVAELERDESVPFEKVELLTALREYWLSMQIAFDYDSYRSYCIVPATSAAPPPRTKASPFFDVAETKSTSLGKFVSLFLRVW